MGYRRRRSGHSRSSYGTERAKWHIQQAKEFSEEVGHADEAVKEAFFSLSGKSLEYLLRKYGDKYGDEKEQYARQTIPKWKAGIVQMSGMVAKRLFDLLPPFMPAEQKNRVVEAVWKRYGPRSRKYIYVGRDSNPEAIVASLETYFNKINVAYPIPGTLKARFDWLSDNDAVAKERLLNHFMDQQRQAAIASARLNIPMMLDGMKADEEGRISKLTHTVFVGNHHVEIKADPLRSGFVLSNSPNDQTRSPSKFSWPAGLGIAAVILIGFFIVNSTLHSNVPALPQRVAETTRRHWAAPPPQSQPFVLKTRPAVVPPLDRTSPAVVQRQPGAPPQTSLSSQRSPSQGITAVAPAAVDGCQNLQIASVNGDGSQIVVSNGNRYNVSDNVMRMTASNWATGDLVGVCFSSEDVSLKVGYSSIQATAVGTTSVDMKTCRNLYIAYTTADGSSVGATDGSLFHLVPNDVLKMTASSWTTGQSAVVCTALHDGTTYAALRVGYSKVQATLASIGTGRDEEASCSDATVEGGGGESGRLRVGNSVYQIENAVMQMTAQQFVTGDAVVVCKYSTESVTYVSIAKGYSRVQATQI